MLFQDILHFRKEELDIFFKHTNNNKGKLERIKQFLKVKQPSMQIVIYSKNYSFQ